MTNLTVEYECLTKSNAGFMSDLERAAVEVIRSGWFILGKEVTAFENDFAAFTGSRHCIGVANGLDALILSIEALNLPAHSDILVASNTYIATILAIVKAGHHPVLVEPDIRTFNMDPQLLEQALTANTKAVCVTHLFGKACQMNQISAFTKTHNLKLIEDCAQSHGATHNGVMTGRFGDAGCYSFYPTKNLGALGDAGAIVTDDDNIADRLRYLRSYGSKIKYENTFIGINSRLDEMQAAMLRVKLRHLDAMTKHKRELASIYVANLPNWVTLPLQEAENFDVFHIFGIQVEKRNELREFLLNQGIKTEIHYPIAPHRQKAMAGILSGQYPIADQLHATELSLPISVGHTSEEIYRVCDVVKKFAP